MCVCMCGMTPLSWGSFCGGELVQNVVCHFITEMQARVRDSCFIILLQVLTWYIGVVIDIKN